MPNGIIDIEEVIEKMQEFSEANSEDNKKILQQILDKVNELNKKVTDLETGLKEGKFGVPVGTNPSSSTNPLNQSPSQQTSGGGDSTTPSEPTEAQKKEKAWNDFFSGKSDITDQGAWKNSGLAIEDAQKIYSNGWNKPNLTEYESDGQKTTSIEPLNHKRSEIDKAHKLLNKIKNETNLSNLPGNNDIETYDQSKVPNSINHDGIKAERDNKIKSLFKTAFEKGGTSGLSDDEIDKWRTTESTGLSKNGTEERKVFDNGWTKSEDIKNKTTNYQGLGNIDVLKIKRLDIDSEIKKADNLLNDISEQTSLHDLIPNYKEEEIKALKDELLPPNKKSTDIINKRKEVRGGLWFNLTSTDLRDKGINSELLSLAEIEEKNVWDIREYDPLTPEILNAFLNACEGVEVRY